MRQINVGEVLESLGLEYSERSAEANALCPAHFARTGREDHSPSWWINLESGMHICFSCGYKGNILHLVCDVLQFYTKTAEGVVYDYRAAEEWLAGKIEVSPERLLEIVRALPNYVESYPKPVPMSEARLVLFTEPPQEALDSRNITAESAQAYGDLWDPKKSAWVLPLRDPYLNELMGWQEKGTVQRTFFNRPTGLQKSKTLFGVQNQQEDLVVVVESPLDCLRLFSAGFTSAVAICGSAPSVEQIRLLRYSDRIIAAFDTDTAGKKASKEMLEFARKYGLNLSYFNYGSTGKKDPGDLTDDEIAWGIHNAKSSVLGEKAYV